MTSCAVATRKRSGRHIRPCWRGRPRCAGAGWHALAAPGADPAFLDNVTYHLAGALASTDLHHTTTDFRFLVERVWRSGPAALEAEAARYYSMFPVLRMDRFAMELGELVHGEAHLLAGHVRRLDLAVTLHSRCLAWKEVRRRLHHTHEVLRGGLVATEPFPDDPDGRLWRVLTGHTGPVHALCWRADGRVLVSGSGDGTLRIRRVDDERPDAVVDVAGEGDGSVVSLSWSPDVSTLAVGTDRGEVVLVDPSEHRITRRLVLSEEDQQRVMVAFTPDSRAVTVALGKEVRLWHEPYDKDGLGPPLPGPRDTSCTAVRWHEHGGLAVGLADGRVQLWERAATEAEPTVVDTGGPSVQALDWHPDGDLLAVIGHSATVTVIDRRSATVVARISDRRVPGRRGSSRCAGPRRGTRCSRGTTTGLSSSGSSPGSRTDRAWNSRTPSPPEASRYGRSLLNRTRTGSPWAAVNRRYGSGSSTGTPPRTPDWPSG